MIIIIYWAILAAVTLLASLIAAKIQGDMDIFRIFITVFLSASAIVVIVIGIFLIIFLIKWGINMYDMDQHPSCPQVPYPLFSNGTDCANG